MIAFAPATDIVGVIDLQPTFMPGGELPVTDGAAVVPIINRILAGAPHAFATQDWHPADHTSFVENHPGHAPFSTVTMPYGPQTLWPRHAVQGSPNARLHPELEQARIELVLRKGVNPAIDSYSAFFENDRVTSTGLEGYLRSRGFLRIFLCGLAGDYCVAWSAEDAARLGFATFVVEDACRSLALPDGSGGTTLTTAQKRLAARGVRFVTSADLGPGVPLVPPGDPHQY